MCGISNADVEAWADQGLDDAARGTASRGCSGLIVLLQQELLMCMHSLPFPDFIGGICICAQSLNGGAKLISSTCRSAALVACLDQACC